MTGYRSLLDRQLAPLREIEWVDRRETIENERPSGFVVSVDMGRHADYSFLTVNDAHRAERVLWGRSKFSPEAGVIGRKPVVFHRFTNMHRYSIGTTYPDVIQSIKDVLEQLPPRPHEPELVIDATGVGTAVADMMRERGLRPFAITITAGNDVTNETSRSASVPKAVLATTMDAALAADRVKFAAGEPAAEILRIELQNFQIKTRSSGSIAYEAGGNARHDDGVLSAQMSIWRASTRKQQGARFTYVSRRM